MNSIKPWILATRPKTLLAILAPIIVGLSLSYKISGTINWFLSLMIIASAILLQIGSNYANDAYDFLRGADNKFRKGPRRMVQEGNLSINAVLNAMYFIFIVSVIIGYFLAKIGGWPIVIIGLSSIIFAIIYTGGPYPLAYNGFGDITVFIFFGLIATVGTVYLQLINLNIHINDFVIEIFIASAAVGCLNTAILVVNNLRDIDSDKLVNKKTLAVKFGSKFTCYEFAILLITNCCCYCWLAYIWKNYILIAVVILIALLSFVLIYKVFEFKNVNLNTILERTAQLSFLSSILFFIAVMVW